MGYALLSKNQQIVESAFTIEINPTVRSVEVVRYVHIRDKEDNAKTAEEVVYANISDKEVNAKTVEVVRYANIRE